MSIIRIERLRDYGIFRDFTWPDDLPAFGRYNLIYGWSWSGKTTLSRLFRALEARMHEASDSLTRAVIVIGSTRERCLRTSSSASCMPRALWSIAGGGTARTNRHRRVTETLRRHIEFQCDPVIGR